MNRMFRVAASCAILAPLTTPASAEPANTLKELGAKLRLCVTNPGANFGTEITIIFSLKRNGELLGRPKITYSKMPADPDRQRRAAAAVASALSHCLPLSISDALGGAIAGRPLTIHLVGRKQDTDI